MDRTVPVFRCPPITIKVLFLGGLFIIKDATLEQTKKPVPPSDKIANGNWLETVLFVVHPSEDRFWFLSQASHLSDVLAKLRRLLLLCLAYINVEEICQLDLALCSIRFFPRSLVGLSTRANSPIGFKDVLRCEKYNGKLIICVNRRKSAVNISFPNLAPFAPLREDLFFQIARSVSL